MCCFNKVNLSAILLVHKRTIKHYMFRTVPLSIIRSISLYTHQRYMSNRFADSLRAGSGWNCSSVLILLASCNCNLYDIYRRCVYSEKPLMMDRGTVRNIHSFIPKNKFQKLVHQVGFIIGIYHDARSLEHQTVRDIYFFSSMGSHNVYFIPTVPPTGKCWSEDCLEKTKTCRHIGVLMFVPCCSFDVGKPFYIKYRTWLEAKRYTSASGLCR